MFCHLQITLHIKVDGILNFLFSGEGGQEFGNSETWGREKCKRRRFLVGREVSTDMALGGNWKNKRFCTE